MKFNTIYFLVFILINVSCSKNDDFGKAVKTIYLKETKDILPISSFIKKLDYLELSFQADEISIGKIEGIKNIGNEIIIKQRKARETSYLRFSKDGVFKNIIAQSGNEIDVFKDIIKYNKDFAVWGETGIHIISGTGKYKKKLFELDVPGNSFFYSKNKFFLFHESVSPGYLSRYNSNGKQEKVYFPNENQTTNSGYSNISMLGKDNYQFFSPLIDTVFAFSENKLIPKYRVDGSPFPTFIQILENVGDLDRLETLKYINNNQHVVIKNYLENRNYIFITYWVGSISNNLIINKKSWQTTYFDKAINDIDGGIWGTPLYLSDDDILYIPINSSRIGSHKILNKRKRGFVKLKEKNQVGDNSIIMRCKLK
ncbi:MAG: 6-bladed beta-propeller [Prolixibacteraceae bacterium]|jgi:hypothetical protein|nr:6-bladed beta-propeller [Prolixibacteraceae bacterium]MBT6763874.1 6-bladed beta-propeller [Prolixibacteraceae bacterium]MBT7396301.1 6-bladed beta-propeller [Prolixibacteraceae bacterium]